MARTSSAAYKQRVLRPRAGLPAHPLYFHRPSYRQRLTVPEIPFSRIDEMGAGMYRGKKTAAELVPNSQLTKAQNIAT